MKDDQFGPPVAVQIGNCDAATLIVIPKPTGNRYRIGPATRDVAARIETPADAVVAVVAARRIVDMKTHQLGPPIAVEIRNRNAATRAVIAEPARNRDRRGPATRHVTVR